MREPLTTQEVDLCTRVTGRPSVWWTGTAMTQSIHTRYVTVLEHDGTEHETTTLRNIVTVHTGTTEATCKDP